MEIDKIIDIIKDKTDNITIITNKKTIDYFLDDIKKNTVSEFSVDNFFPSKTKYIKSIYRNTVTVNFIDINDTKKWRINYDTEK